MTGIMQFSQSEREAILRQAVVVIAKTLSISTTTVCSIISADHWEIASR